MLCPILVGRDAELRSLRDALGKAADGAGHMVFVVGGAGVGKSRLVREVSALASARGFQTLRGRAAESAVPVAFRPVAEALMRIARAGLPPDLPELASYRPALAAMVPEWSRPGDEAGAVSPIVLGEAVLRLLTLTGSQGTLLLLEDLHWADPETLGIVEYLADNLAAARVLCVVTLRDADPSAGLSLYRSLRGRRAADAVELRGLPDAEVWRMAAACLGVEEIPAGVRRLLADCDGLPFAVEEILAAATSSGQLVRSADGWRVDPRVQTVVPESIAGSVRSRLAGLGTGVTDVLSSAAVLGRTFDWTLLPEVAGVSEVGALAALQQAQDVQLIEPLGPATDMFRFRHSLTRHAILADLLAPDLARRSARAAAAIERAHPGLPDGWCGLAAELHETAGQPERAIELLVEAGIRDRRRGALDSAKGELSRARALVGRVPATEPALAFEAGEELAKALALAGDQVQLGKLADELMARTDAARADPDLRARILLMAARTESECDRRAATAHLAGARAIAARLRDPMTLAGIDVVGARCALDAGQLDRACELAQRALAVAGPQAAGSHRWGADVAIEALVVIGRRERGRDLRAARVAFERALQIADDKSYAVHRISALHELGTIDMLDSGDTRRLREARELAQETGATSVLMAIDLQLASIWSLGTDLDCAMAAARQSEVGASQLQARQLQAMAISAQALIFGIRADRREATLAAERAERLLPDDPELLLTTWGQARVVASLFLDDLPRALRESTTAVRLAGEAAIASPRRAWGLYAILQAVSDESRVNAAGQSRAAGHLGDAAGRARPDAGVREAVERARMAGAASSWNRGLLAYADAVLAGRDGHPDQAAALVEEGSALLSPYAPWWNNLARRLVAPSAMRDGWGEPVGWLRQATVEFEASGQHVLASACRGLLRQAGERVPRAGRGTAQVPAQMRRLGVTSREMDVFLLVAHGFSNAEIAERLFISPKTVETHVASLVAKTGQTGRRELVAHAARLAPS